MKVIPYREYPGAPRLVADMMEAQAGSFGYTFNPDAAWWRERSHYEQQQQRPYTAIAARLKENAAAFHYHEAAYANLDALAQPGTLVVVTGQQVGLAGGPLYSLYKALTAIAYARRMETESGVRTVPVFWMAGSDHNFAEVGRCWWIDTKNELQQVKRNLPENSRPCGGIQLETAASELIERLTDDLPDSDFKPELMKLLSEAYRPEYTYGYSFHRFMVGLLSRFGMVFLDADDEVLKRLSQPFWLKAVDTIPQRLHRAVERGRELEQQGYMIQVPVEENRPALFVLEDGHRRKVILDESARHGKGDILLSLPELRDIAASEPERFSIGVTLRPLWQQWLLPAAAFVGGPHEIAYWAQLDSNFDQMNLRPPALLHRLSVTLVETKIRRKLEKLNVEAADLLGDVDGLRESLLKSGEAGEVFDQFSRIRTTLEENKAELSAQTGTVYSGMDKQIDQAFDKMTYQLDRLEGQFKQRRQQADQAFGNGFDLAALHLRPGDSFQERLLSPVYYLARYGDRLLDGLLSIADKHGEGHVIVDVEELEA